MINRNYYVLLCTTSALGLVASPLAAAQDAALLAAPSAAEASASDIVVTGIRRSLETAQSIKQESDQILDSIVAEDIGKLPDVTVAESLARITGVQVDRSNGEAAGVRVRGLPDLATTYNGREIFTAEGRSVALQDFPSNSIARIDVYKSASANLVEAGLAGLVDVRARMPLDFKGDRIAGALNGVHWSQSGKTGIDASLLVSKRWSTGIGDIGFLIEGSYADVNFLDSARNVSQTILNRTNVPGYSQALRYPSFVNIDYARADRWRPSAHAALQWRPSDDLEFYLDGLFQGFRGKGESRNLNIASGPAATLTDIELYPDSDMIRSMTATAGGFPTGAQQATVAKTDTYQFGGGFKWKTDRLLLSGDVAWTDSTYTFNGFGFNYTLTTQPTRHFDFDTDAGVGGGTVTLSGVNLFDPALYRLTGISESGNRNHGRDIQARLDAEYALPGFFLDKLQVGIRFNRRTADSYRYAPPNGVAPAGQFFSVLPLNFENVPAGFKGDEADSVRTWLTPTRESILANADYLRTLTGRPTGRPDWEDPVYTGSERGYAAYAQVHYNFDIGVPVDGLIGLRAVRTENEINGLARATMPDGSGGTTVVTTPITRENSYEDFLPNVSLRAQLAPELQLRLAFTETRTRPGFGSLNPSVTLGIAPAVCSTDPSSVDCIRTASGGNPELKPIQSKNYDASLEYYFSRDGAITLGAFHRDVSGFINNTTTQVDDAEFGRLNINRPENGGKGRIRGIEASFRTFLRAPWLPDWMRDFGVLANYTYLDHASQLAPTLAATRPGMQPIAGVSKHLVNLSAFYENRTFSARVAYNYRSSFVVSYGQVADPALGTNVLGPTLPVVESGRGTLDFNSTLNPTENITISFGIANLLGAAATNERQFNALGQTYPWQTRFLETVYRLGIRFRV